MMRMQVITTTRMIILVIILVVKTQVIIIIIIILIIIRIYKVNKSDGLNVYKYFVWSNYDVFVCFVFSFVEERTSVKYFYDMLWL